MEEEGVNSKLWNLQENILTPPPPQLLQHLLSHWISLPSSSNLVKALIEYAGDTNTSLVPSTPPSPADLKHQIIPQFYFPGGRPPPTTQVREECLNRIDELFSTQIHGLDKNEFRKVTKQVCRLPFFLSSSLLDKIVPHGSSKITRNAFVEYWVQGNMLTMDKPTQIFNILKQPHRNYLTQADFLTLLGELCAFHPGLHFIEEEALNFEGAYAATVLFRIFYYINRSRNGRITLRELKRGDLVPAMQYADEEADINKVLRYFSHEHFLLIYWKFRNMVVKYIDGDEMLINKTDLEFYNDSALSLRILDRIFSQVPRSLKSKIEEKMCYEDFVYFILAEEDKQSEPSLEYWFRCIDLDGNGILTCDELKYFYEEQVERMLMDDEGDYVPFDYMLDRVIDMIAPEGKGIITWRDVKASKLSGDFFNILVNINKSMPSQAFQRRQADRKMLARLKRLNENIREWDLFALREVQGNVSDHTPEIDIDFPTTSETGSSSCEVVPNPIKKQKVLDKGKRKIE